MCETKGSRAGPTPPACESLTPAGNDNRSLSEQNTCVSENRRLPAGAAAVVGCPRCAVGGVCHVSSPTTENLRDASYPISTGRNVEHRDRAIVRSSSTLAEIARQRYRATVHQVLRDDPLPNPQHQCHYPNGPPGSLPTSVYRNPPAIYPWHTPAPMSPVSPPSSTGARPTHDRHHGCGRLE